MCLVRLDTPSELLLLFLNTLHLDRTTMHQIGTRRSDPSVLSWEQGWFCMHSGNVHVIYRIFTFQLFSLVCVLGHYPDPDYNPALAKPGRTTKRKPRLSFWSQKQPVMNIVSIIVFCLGFLMMITSQKEYGRTQLIMKYPTDHTDLAVSMVIKDVGCTSIPLRGRLPH